jgi:hypothetical protein
MVMKRVKQTKKKKKKQESLVFGKTSTYGLWSAPYKM